MRLALAWLRRDALELLTYKSQIIARALGWVGLLFSAHFVARTFAEHEPPALAQYGGYFPFLLTGLLVADLAWALLAGPSDRIRQAQLTGTLEMTAAGPLRGAGLFACEGLSPVLWAMLREMLTLGGAAAVGAITFRVSDPLAATLSVLLSIAALYPIGLIGGAITLLLKRSDPLGRLTHSLAMLVSGVAYPVEVLPGWLGVFAEALPTTHAFEALRGAWLLEQDLRVLAPSLLMLAGFAVAGGAIALLFCGFADRQARRLGTLGHY